MSAWITVEDCLKGRALAVDRERKRIIALLEKLKSAPACFELDLDALIANIKGDKDE